MISAPLIIVVGAIVAFLGGTAFGVLVLFIISIHRTSRAPLSQIHHQRAGSLSRRVLTGIRSANRKDDQ